MKPLKAVLTADIVNSSQLSQKQLDDLLFAVKTELKWQNAKSDFYRGDSFHTLCAPEQSLVLALRLRAIARHGTWQGPEEDIDIRIAIGIGTVEDPVKSIATAKGEAFTLSGRELDAINKTRTRLAIRCSDAKLDAGMQGIALLADMLMRNLSVKQAEVVNELIKGATQMEIARKLGKSQSTINQLAQAAGWNELEKAIAIYARMISLTDQSS